MAALDGVEGELVVEGWQRSTGKRVVDQIRDLRGLVGGFLVTFVEKEGRLGGSDMSAARTVVDLAGDVSVTVAGGISTTEEVADLDRLGADAQVGMALYTDHLDLADAFTAPLVSDRPDGLWPTVVADELGTTLGLVYSSAASVRAAVASRRGVYWSRSRGLWEKGATSGATQRLIRAQADCDRDSLLFTVCQEGGGFCHRETRSCFGGDRGFGALERRLSQRLAGESSRSLTKKLIQDSAFLEAKLLEEAAELADAGSTEEVIWEAADLLYFAAVALRRRGVGFADVAAELDRRALAVRRRDGSSTYAGGSQ